MENKKSNEFQIDDQPKGTLGQDELNRESYVQELTDVLRNCHTPMTVAVQGDWGVGKTSVMNMVREMLADDENVRLIEFNPWRNSMFHREEQVTVAFFEEMLRHSSDETAATDDSVKNIRKILSGLAVDLTRRVVGNNTAEAVETLVCGDESLSCFSEQMKQLDEYFKKMVENSKEDRLIFFVDDMNCIRPKTAVDLLEIFKIFFDHPKCIFVVAVDVDTISVGVKEKYGRAITDEKAKAFLNKMFQLVVQIPALVGDDDSFWGNILPQDVEQQQDVETADWVKQALYPMTRGIPRELKRFSNTLDLRYRIEKKKAYWKVGEDNDELWKKAFNWNIRYLILDTMMSMYYPGIYRLYKLRMSFPFQYRFLKYGQKVNDKGWTKKRAQKLLDRLGILDGTDTDDRLSRFCRMLYDFFDQYRRDNHTGDENLFKFRGIEREVYLVWGKPYSFGPQQKGPRALADWMDSILSEPFHRINAGESVLQCGRCYDYYSGRSHIAEGKYFFRLHVMRDIYTPGSEEEVIVEFYKKWMDERTDGQSKEWMDNIRKSLAFAAQFSEINHISELKEVGEDDCKWEESNSWYSFKIRDRNQAVHMMGAIFEIAHDCVVEWG